MVIIGIDPAFRKNGFWACFLDIRERTAQFRCFRNVLEFDRFLTSEDAPERAFVVVENSNLQNITFSRHMGGKMNEITRKSRNVGTNQAVSELTYVSAVDRYGKDAVLGVSPERKGAKYNEQYFRAALKGDGVQPVNYSGTQDERDAYKLAHMGIFEIKKSRGLFSAKHRVRI
jgi:hypothetical protein